MHYEKIICNPGYAKQRYSGKCTAYKHHPSSKSLLTNTNKPVGNICTCNPNQLTLLKSKPNAELFGKMTKLTVDTVDYKPSTVTVYENVSVNQLLNTTAAVNPDRMPIAKPENTDSRMPIVQTDRTAYTMPIVGKTQPRVYYPTVSPKKVVDGVEVRP